MVILPDHLHCLWTLPDDDGDYSTRWMVIKAYFTRRCPTAFKTARSDALRHKREQTIWQHRDGAIQAYLFGESTQREGLFRRLQDLLDRPDWHERYEDWRRAMASRTRLALIRRLGWEIKQTPSPERLEALLAEFKQRYVSASICRFIERRLRGLLSALVAELLAQAGLTAERMRCLDERLDLPGDLVRLLTWELQVPVLELLNRQARATGAMARLENIELVRLFESYSERLQRLGRTVLDRLHGWLVDLCV